MPMRNVAMQRPCRNRLSEGSYAENSDTEDVELDELNWNYTDEEDAYDSSESDDEFVDETPVKEVDRCQIYYMFSHYFPPAH